MSEKPNWTSEHSLARHLRIGLLGSPYDWGSLNFEEFQSNGVSLTLTSFAGTRDSRAQDLLFLTNNNPSNSNDCLVKQNELDLLETEIPNSSQLWLTPQWMHHIYGQSIEQLNDLILHDLHEHEDQYVGTEKIIARYGIQVLRVVSVLNRTQVHIENEALAYLIEAPWRNENELDYIIARMVFYLEGDVLRKSYVQRTVYEFGTAARGVSNSNGVKNLINSMTNDVLTNTDFQTAARLFQISLAPKSFALPSSIPSSARRKAA